MWVKKGSVKRVQKKNIKEYILKDIYIMVNRVVAELTYSLYILRLAAIRLVHYKMDVIICK